MSRLKQQIQAATFAYRDVPVCLDGALVFEREQLISQLVAASRDLRAAQNDAIRYDDGQAAGDTGDDRLSQVDPVRDELEQQIAEQQQRNDDLAAAIEKLEQQMVEHEVVLRFTALPKDEYEQIRLTAGKDSAALYSMLARASGQELDDGELYDIEPAVWDLLEPKLTAGMWLVICQALDAINVVEGKQGLSFLRRGSAATPS